MGGLGLCSKAPCDLVPSPQRNLNAGYPARECPTVQVEVLPLTRILLAASLIAGPPSQITRSNVFHRGGGGLGTGRGLPWAHRDSFEGADTTRRDVTGFSTYDRMSDVLVKGRQGSVSLLNYCGLKSCVGEDVKNVMRAGASVLTLCSFLGLMCKMSAQ